MMHDGSIVLFRFPQTNRTTGKLRPALVLRKLPGPYHDWLICMVSTQLSQRIEGLDEVIGPADPDFNASGLKAASLFRVSRLAVAGKSVFVGVIGEIPAERLARIRTSLAQWIQREPGHRFGAREP